MAEIHRTTLAPSKIELLTDWLPHQPWYRGTGRPPSLTRAGGFRLDDPAGEVGIEFLLLAEVVDGDVVAYHVPLSYRGAPLAEAQDALVGTAEHGVLGRRWIYDGARDPVAIAQLLALVTGDAEAQHQSESRTPDPSVTRSWSLTGRLTPGTPLSPSDATPGRTRLPVDFHGEGRAPDRRLHLQVIRVLQDGGRPDADIEPADEPVGHVEADLRLADGTTARRQVAVVS